MADAVMTPTPPALVALVDVQKACAILGFPEAGGEQRDRVRRLLETLDATLSGQQGGGGAGGGS